MHKVQKTLFLGGFWTKFAQKEFFSKIGLRHILGIAILHLCAKNQQKLMSQSREKLVTNERTNEHGLIYRTSKVGPKTSMEIPILRVHSNLLNKVQILNAEQQIQVIYFADFWHKDAKWQCPNCDGARFPEKIHFRPKMPEICRKTGFLAFSRDFFISFF